MVSGSPRLVIGLGTGRCGTHSLAGLLGMQDDTVSFHQPEPCLPWHPDYGWYRYVGEFVEAQSTRVVALVGWYYLNYCDLLARDFDTRFVCLRRERAETVASIARLTTQFDNWSNRPPHESASDRYRPLFPQYDVDDKIEALGLYHDEYYDRAERHRDADPDRFRIFATDDLNRPERVTDLLTGAGFDAPVVKAGILLGEMDDYQWTGDN